MVSIAWTGKRMADTVEASLRRRVGGFLVLVAIWIGLTRVDVALADTPQRIEGTTMPLQYPPTRAQDIVETMFGVPVADPYRWLEDVKSSEVTQWMDSQDKVTRDYLHALPGRDALAERLRSLLYLETISSPTRRGNRYFYTRRHADKEKSIVYWKEGEAGAERVLLDPNTMSSDGSISLGVWNPTYDGSKVVYAIRARGADEATLYLIEVATGVVSKTDVIEGAKYANPDWTPEGHGFYYTFLPTDPAIPVDQRPGFAEVRFHKLGDDPKNDKTVHPRTGDPQKFIGANLSRDGRWLFVTISKGWIANDVYYRDLQAASAEWKPFVVDKNALTEVAAWKGNFYIATNDGAPKWRIYRTDDSKPERESWREIVPEREDAVIESTSIRGDHLALRLLRNAKSEAEIRDLDGKLVRTVALPGIGSVSSLSGDEDDDDAYFLFSSFTTPWEIYKTSIRDGGSDLWAKTKVPVDGSPYEVEQVWYPSKDGTKISMFIIRRKDMPKDGSTPFLLYGYGGFNINLTPGFSASLFAWLDAGGGYALPNLRGGGEYGEEWHRAGMLANKQNVFDDFIAAAEYLLREGYTKSERLAIRGGSNGGLLVGAVMTQRPELYRAVVCEVPLLDMVRYHLFGSGRTWIAEYGSSEDESLFRTLVQYSPYHRVKKGTHYPAFLMMSADNDDRVDPMHARKFIAMLQASSDHTEPILLRIERNAGHGGADLVKKTVESQADVYSFLMHELGMRSPKESAATPK